MLGVAKVQYSVGLLGKGGFQVVVLNTRKDGSPSIFVIIFGLLCNQSKSNVYTKLVFFLWTIMVAVQLMTSSRHETQLSGY